MLARVVAALLLGLGPSGSSAVAFSFQDSEITEASAMVVMPGGLFVTTNDSGDVGRIFTVDRSGRTVGTTYWNPDATDVESLAPADATHIWVGDTGDNTASRDHIEVAKVPISREGRRDVTPVIYRLRYPDGSHDAETLLAAPDGRLLIVTKGFLGGTLYAAPAHLSASSINVLTPLSSPNVMLPMATDGAFLPDGRHFLVRGYTSATLYSWPGLDRLGSMPLPGQKQGEGLGIAPDDTLWLSSEGVHSPVLHIGLSAELKAILAGPASSGPSAATTSGTPAPGPVTGSGSLADDSTGTPGGWWPWTAGGVVALGLVAYLLRRRR